MSVSEIRKDFPILKTLVHGKPLIYLDSAATSQKPRCVLDAMDEYYATMNANIHRGVHALSEQATARYEDVRQQAAQFFGVFDAHEIVFTKGTTEGINIIARGWGDEHIGPDDDIVVSSLEHHANLVPWQELAQRKKAHLKVIPLAFDYQLDYDAFLSLLNPRTKLVCITALSNVTGTPPQLDKYIAAAHAQGARVLIDAAQGAAHMPFSIQKLDCDFFVCSSHKMYGPTGVGILYGKRELLQTSAPLIYGGDMVTTVDQYSAQYSEIPWRFEGGTPNIAGVIGFGAALSYLAALGMDAVYQHSQELLSYAHEVFGAFSNLTLLSPMHHPAIALLSFVVSGIHPHDIASIFDSEGVAIRSGFHCTEPLHAQLGLEASARMSFGVYTAKEDIDKAEQALKKVCKIFSLPLRPKLKTKS